MVACSSQTFAFTVENIFTDLLFILFYFIFYCSGTWSTGLSCTKLTGQTKLVDEKEKCICIQLVKSKMNCLKSFLPKNFYSENFTRYISCQPDQFKDCFSSIFFINNY